MDDDGRLNRVGSNEFEIQVVVQQSPAGSNIAVAGEILRMYNQDVPGELLERLGEDGALPCRGLGCQQIRCIEDNSEVRVAKLVEQ